MQERREVSRPFISRLQSIVNEEMVKINQEIIVACEGQKSLLIPKISNHIISSGGKRLRPMLALFCAAILKVNSKENAIFIGAALELLHTATLLHDDVVDESMMRRGKKTSNVIWGDKPSVLVGDFLFTQAFKIMLKTKSLAALDKIAQAANNIAMAEVYQLEVLGDLSLSFASYLDLIEKKTASLFSAAFAATALANQISDEVVEVMEDYGKVLGVCFQIKDDMLDYFGDEKGIGKVVGGDLREKKITAPIIFVYDKLNGTEKGRFDEIFSINQPYDVDDLQYIKNCCERYNVKDAVYEYCRSRSDGVIERMRLLNLQHFDVIEGLIAELNFRET